VKFEEFDVPPPGGGLNTVMAATTGDPVTAMSLAGT
jgi:hypothetical protein